ncbi:hypothetical protein GY45DRAFT_1328010 [Cubamyces sp. BRFM 1775]|nr:hypothetical protein GY45DRAFT_1328010 [Cubamyces sp. BRFM 1775]
MGLLDALRNPGPAEAVPQPAEDATVDGDSSKLKATIVTQITRALSAERVAGTTGVKADGRAEASGVERTTRWQGGEGGKKNQGTLGEALGVDRGENLCVYWKAGN